MTGEVCEGNASSAVFPTQELSSGLCSSLGQLTALSLLCFLPKGDEFELDSVLFQSNSLDINDNLQLLLV